MPPLHPLLFRPNIHTAIWGREDWLVSAHRSSPSIIDNGPMAGQPFTGAGFTAGRFPVLVKIIEANDALSLQVHPNEKTAPLTGGEPKTEMWHILDAAPGAAIFAGLKPGATPEAVRRGIEDGTLADLLVEHKVKPGETYFIPGGTVHAIGGGVKIFELQQSSATTYRLFDWNRKNTDGTSRELHIEKGCATIDYTLPPPGDSGDSLSCPFFSFQRIDVHSGGALAVAPAGDRFAIVYPPKGAIELSWDGGTMTLEGRAAFIPAGLAVTLGAPRPTPAIICRANA